MIAALDEIKMNFKHTLGRPHDLLISHTETYIDLNSSYLMLQFLI